ncbi:hypothetical protein B0I35DRAFT_480511 [Stachybotrys elegans]|uniref:Uncharacterized protein n=1 Tax=Stachybotrys elegans TaxID=80388 RepID=A0A8K0SSD5_9HYPO|nr:hypothetical protein B0I35DRAFT_480511 [Stachybotrys elegans]
MPTCQLNPKPDMYGLGIRTAFYIQWFGALAIEWLDETDTMDMRVLGLLLSGAMLIGAVIQISQDHLEAAEIYIALLLAAGAYLFLVPLWIWRGLTLCSPYWNPFRWNKEKMSPVFRFGNFACLTAVAATATWYYTSYLPGLDRDCSQFGFFFGPVSLQNNVYIAFNAILYIMMLVVLAFFVLMSFGCEFHMWSKERRRAKVHRMHIEVIRTCRMLSNLVVFGVLVAGVELSIDWNNLQATNEIMTAAQTIPLVVSAGFVSRSLFLYAARRSADDGSSDASSVMVRRTYRRSTVETSGPSWPPTAHTK